MAKIKIEYKTIDTTVAAIERYTSQANTKMSEASAQVQLMKHSWQGDDATGFQSKWQEITASTSSHRKMITSLTSYASFLKYVKTQYRDAQDSAKSRARMLP